MRLITQFIRKNIIASTFLASVAIGAIAMQTENIRQNVLSFVFYQSQKMGFTLETVKVAGNNAIATKDILSLIALPQGYPMLAINNNHIRDKLQNVGWIKNASISKQYPNALVVKIQERTPIAIWQNKGNYQLIGSEGHLMGTQGITKYLDLLLLVGNNAPERMDELQNIFHEMPLIKDNIKTASWISNRRWTLTTKSGIEILLPAKSPLASAKYLNKLQRRKQILNRDIIRVDLRIIDRVVVKLRTDKTTSPTSKQKPKQPA